MADDATGEERDEDLEAHAEPDRMSWFVFLFMSLCLFMTAVMAYYAWQVFTDAV